MWARSMAEMACSASWCPGGNHASYSFGRAGPAGVGMGAAGGGGDCSAHFRGVRTCGLVRRRGVVLGWWGLGEGRGLGKADMKAIVRGCCKKVNVTEVRCLKRTKVLK